MIFFKGHKFIYAPDLNEFQTQNKSKTLIHPDQLYPIQSMISERTVPSMFFSQFDFAITHSTNSFAGNTLPTLSNIFYAMLCKNCRRIALVSFCRKRTSLTERILPETHFLRPVVFFIQCYLKIVDE